MASPEALIKYYDCLRDSFNKIQVKDNKNALVNAALRPRIREELAKSKDLLASYLDYLKVFTLIYSDKFPNICISIICPLFRENRSDWQSKKMKEESTRIPLTNSKEVIMEKKNASLLLHDTIQVIFKSKPELIDEFIQSVIKLFPTITDGEGIFLSYLSNALETCTYIRGEPLTNLVAKILDRLNPPPASDTKKNIETDETKKLIKASFELVYQYIDSIESTQYDNVSAAILAAFSREFLTSRNEAELNYLLLYLCSKKDELSDLFLNLMWANFTDNDRSLEERRLSVLYASSFIARANYIKLDKVINQIETATIWCNNLVNNNANSDSRELDGKSTPIDLFYPLVESILYLITQRYREMYEEETIKRLKALNLDDILDSHLKPLDRCSAQTVTRFCEVATLYGICSIKYEPKIKRRKKLNESVDSSTMDKIWTIPYKENADFIPDRISSMYRSYYNHRNFTICRD